MSARTLFTLVSGLVLTAPIAAHAAPPPPSATAPAANETKPVDEAALATRETKEQALTQGDGIAAVVNDSPISNYDVRQRVALYTATSGSHPSADVLKQIREQVLKQLETERLELLEAEKAKVTVSAADVDKAINDILKDNHLTQDQLNKLLLDASVRMETLRAQIAAQIAWTKLVQDQLGDRVHVSDLDVDDELARLKRGSNKPHYVVAEIFQAVDTPEQDGKVQKDMENLKTQLDGGAPFSAVARQFSQNPTAAQGGDLGTIQEGQLAPELDKVLLTMRPGATSAPIRGPGGYYILFLRELQEPEGASGPDFTPAPTGPPGTMSFVRLTLPIGAKPPPKLLDNAIKAAAMMRSQNLNCTMAKEMNKRLPGTLVSDMKDFKLAELSTEMQSAIAQAGPGGSTQPLVSSVGVELLVRCDKPVPKIGHFALPSRTQVQDQIFEEQISTLARQYLRDLRREADIEPAGKS